jgi:hypothetical protein
MTDTIVQELIPLPPPPPLWATSNTRYRPLALLGGVLQGMLVGVAVLDLTLALVARHALDTLDAAPINAGIIGLGLGVIATAGITFVWCHRATANAEVLGARDLGFTPASAVWWWFVPFANLVKVPQLMSALSKASRPEVAPGTDWRRAAASRLVPAWWGTWLLVRVLSRLASGADSLDSFWISDGGLALLVAADLLSVVLAIAVFRGITADQRHRATRLARAGLQPPDLADHAAT